MGLAKNVDRWPATSWWRRRSVDPGGGRSRTIAISLRGRLPGAARRIVDALNARPDAVVRRLALRKSTFEDAHQDLAAVVDGIVWTRAPRRRGRVVGLRTTPLVANRVDDEPAALSPDQDQTILLALGRDAHVTAVHSLV